MTSFLLPTIGGVLIGVAIVFLMASTGKIGGISGIFWGTFSQLTPKSDRLWRWLFILGLPLGALLGQLLLNSDVPTIPNAPLRAAVAGLLVGIGVKLGNGCTSGHGVCGIGRLSLRSLVATSIFMSTAIITVALTH